MLTSTPLHQLDDKAAKTRLTGVRVSSLDSPPESEFRCQKYARPPGYSAQTLLHFGRLAVLSFLDYGATLALWAYGKCMTSMGLWEHSGNPGLRGKTMGLWGNSETMGPLWGYSTLRPLWDHGNTGSCAG